VTVSDTTDRSVFIWVYEGTWRASVDHAACPVLLVWPDSPPGVGTIPPPPHHPPR
jgi:hypothetical protein